MVRAMDAPATSTPVPTNARPPVGCAPPFRSQLLLCGFAVAALGMMAYRGYGNGLSLRPTDHTPGPHRHRVDLNTADKAELIQVPGIGPNIADAILSHRRDRGRFTTVDDLDMVYGIGGKTVEKLRPWVKVTGQVDGELISEERPIELLERRSPAISAAPPPSALGKIRDGEPPVDVNAADETALQRLPGIGATLARRIVDARGLDRFRSADDLKRVRGIGPKTVEAVRPYVVCR